MVGFKAAFINELYKIYKKKKVISATIISLLAVLIGQIAVYTIKSNVGLKVAGSSEFPLMILSVITYTIIPLFTIFVAVDTFGGEFSSNTMKLTLTRPVSRFYVYLSKVAAIGTYILFNLYFVMLLSTVSTMIINGFEVEFVRIILAYTSTFFPLLVFSVLVVLVSNIFKGGLAAFFISILLFLALNALAIFFARYQSFFITPMFDWYKLITGRYINFQKIIRVFLILIGCGTMLFTSGYYLFDKKEL